MESLEADILRKCSSQPLPERSSSPNNNLERLPHHNLSKKHVWRGYNLNPHVRIHPTEMQRYLHNLIKNNCKDDSNKNNQPMILDALEAEKVKDSAAAASNNVAACEGASELNNAPAGDKVLPPAESKNDIKISIPSKSNQGTAPAVSKMPELPPVELGNQSKACLSSSNMGSDSSTVKAKKSIVDTKKRDENNFKNVDVLYKGTLIARFLTQTECATYLHATPEAISYHCSKGGGVCNGLTIRPCQSTSESLAYGLFEGAEKYRPKGRPQLSKEAVKILKEWLLSPEHVENPYPNQLEMSELEQKTGLDKAQVKHWFNNARKRILKPMLAEHTVDPEGRNKYKNKRIKKSNATNAAKNQPRDKGSSTIQAPSSLFGNVVGLGGDPSLDALRANPLGNHLENNGFYGQVSSGMNFCSGQGSGLSGPPLHLQPANPFGVSTQLNGYGIAGDIDFFHFGTETGGGSRLSNEQEDAERSLESARTNAAFKQQVAAMAMDEANIAFQETDVAYTRARELFAGSTLAKPEEEDLAVIEANAVAKRCQSVAAFKLKVSQRANEEAAKAYASYQQMGGGSELT
eukprot:scaffold97993_cov82-Cyclotella_meneghiniana.AAC.1